jgi:[ribosomal protein S5]-alanine N-acetyltransferase
MESTEINKILDTIVPGHESLNDEIYFEPLSMSGLKEMHEYSIDKRLYEFFEFEPFKTINDTREYINKLINERMSYDGEYKRGMYWFVRRSNDQKLLGTACIVNMDYSRKSLEWGYGIDPKYWGNGYILQIQELLKDYVFSKLNFNRIYGNTFTTNKRAISSLLSAGMKEEGIARQYYFKDGKYVDSWMYAMVREDYLKIKESFAKSNFINENKIIEIISNVLENKDIDINSSMLNVDNWDSLNHMQIIIKLKEELAIDFSPKDIAASRSVKSIIKIIKNE